MADLANCPVTPPDTTAPESDAAAELMPLVYDELCALAARYLRRERPGHTLQPTALVHEAFLRLARRPPAAWRDRNHFLAASAQLVRQLLVEHARARRAHKRGGDRRRVALDLADVATHRPGDHILAVDEALDRLARAFPDRARLVDLRFFAGLSVDEAAEVLGVSPRSAARNWAQAKAWLSRELAADTSRDD